MLTIDILISDCSEVYSRLHEKIWNIQYSILLLFTKNVPFFLFSTLLKKEFSISNYITKVLNSYRVKISIIIFQISSKQ